MTQHVDLGIDQGLRLEALTAVINFVNGVQGAMAASGQGPWIPEKGRMESMAADYFHFLKDGSIPS